MLITFRKHDGERQIEVVNVYTTLGVLKKNKINKYKKNT